MERCGRSSRECACRGRTRGSSSLMYAQLQVAEVTQFLSVWFWSPCGLPVCCTRVRRECGAVRTSTAHCQCFWKVREGRIAFERAVVPLQSFKFSVLYCEQVRISYRCRLCCHCMCIFQYCNVQVVQTLCTELMRIQMDSRVLCNSETLKLVSTVLWNPQLCKRERMNQLDSS